MGFKIATFIGLTFFSFSLFGQSQSVVPVAVDYEKLHGLGTIDYLKISASKNVSDTQDYHVFIRVPDNYSNNPDKQYPTLYLLDGGVNFPLFAPYYGFLRFMQDVPEMIIVGISYGSSDWKKGNARSHDYTAPTDQRKHWGGAQQFDHFLATQLMPKVQATYRVDEKKQILFGQSLGGQFALYTSMYGSAPFYAVISSNPALHRNLHFFLQDMKNPASRPRTFVSIAELDDEIYRIPALKWKTFWQNKESDWDLKATDLANHNHLSANPEAFRNGLMWIFE